MEPSLSESTLTIWVAGEGGAKVLDATSNPVHDQPSVVHTYDDEDIRDVRIHPSGNFVAMQAKNNNIRICRTGLSSTPLCFEDVKGVTCRCLDVLRSGPGFRIAVGRSNRTAAIYDVDAKKSGRPTPSASDDIVCVAALNDHGSIAVATKQCGMGVHSNKALSASDYYSYEMNEELSDMRASTIQPNRIGAAFTSGSVSIWDITSANKKPLRIKADCHKAGARKFSFAPGSDKLCASSAKYPSVHVMALDTGKVISRLKCGEIVSTIAFAPLVSMSLVVGCESGCVKMWDLRNVKQPKWQCDGVLPGAVRALAMVPFSQFSNNSDMPVHVPETRNAKSSSPSPRSKLRHVSSSKENSPPAVIVDSVPQSDKDQIPLVRRQPIGEAYPNAAPTPVAARDGTPIASHFRHLPPGSPIALDEQQQLANQSAEKIRRSVQKSPVRVKSPVKSLGRTLDCVKDISRGDPYREANADHSDPRVSPMSVGFMKNVIHETMAEFFRDNPDIMRENSGQNSEGLTEEATLALEENILKIVRVLLCSHLRSVERHIADSRQETEQQIRAMEERMMAQFAALKEEIRNNASVDSVTSWMR